MAQEYFASSHMQSAANGFRPSRLFFVFFFFVCFSLPHLFLPVAKRKGVILLMLTRHQREAFCQLGHKT